MIYTWTHFDSLGFIWFYIAIFARIYRYYTQK